MIGRFNTWTMVFKILTFISLTLFTFINVNATEIHYFKRSVRALGMGEAFIAVANDENALFYNPAGLRAVENYIFEILTLNVTYSDKLRALVSGDETVTGLDDAFGTRVYFDANATALSITAPSWGYSLFGGTLIDAAFNNPVSPQIETLLFVQYGAVGGYAHSFLDESLDVGASLKTVTRSGVSRTFTVADVLNDKFEEDLQKDLHPVERVAPDVGVIYHYDKLFNLELNFAAVARNIGDIDFGAAGIVRGSYDIGVSTKRKYRGFDLLWAVDLVDLPTLRSVNSIVKNIRLGVEAGAFKRSNNHHTLSYRLGFKGPYSSFGFTINPAYVPITFDYASWSENIGSANNPLEDKRQSLQLSINF